MRSSQVRSSQVGSSQVGSCCVHGAAVASGVLRVVAVALQGWWWTVVGVSVMVVGAVVEDRKSVV